MGRPALRRGVQPALTMASSLRSMVSQPVAAVRRVSTALAISRDSAARAVRSIFSAVRRLSAALMRAVSAAARAVRILGGEVLVEEIIRQAILGDVDPGEQGRGGEAGEVLAEVVRPGGGVLALRAVSSAAPFREWVAALGLTLIRACARWGARVTDGLEAPSGRVDFDFGVIRF